KKWIENHRTIRVAVNGYIPPLSFIDNNKQYQGIIADLLTILSQQTQLNFEIVHSGSVPQIIDQVKQNKADIAIGITLGSVWANNLLTTRSFFFNSWVMVGKNDKKTPTRIAIAKGHPLTNYIRHNYPNAK